jgi:Signal transduction histidine kinase
MKNYYRIATILSIIYFLAIVTFVVIANSKDYKESDNSDAIVKMNDIVGDAGDNWNNLTVLDDKNYGADYVILSTENNILYVHNSSNEFTDKLTIEAAIKKGYPYSYVVKNDTLLGVVVVLYDSTAKYQNLINGIAIGLGILGILLILGMVFYGRYVSKSIIVPFKNMQSFAGRVAEGNLDEPLVMDRNNMFGAFTESFDIMREELAESKKREIALQKKERELVASLSHDLKTPITGIKLTTELLKAKLEQSMLSAEAEDSASTVQSINRDKKEEELVLEKLDNIYKKADQIDVLVSDLFSSTLDDLGEFKVNCCDEESKVLLDIVKKYDDKGLVNSTEIPNVLINIDTKRMSQVIGNIISNSYKYANTPIDISYKIEQEFLEMKIRDHGPGVPENELSLIANKFYRGKQWKESKEEGSGLGLYIAKMLMEKMNGEMLPESSGEGLTITLLIPIS